MCIPVPVSRLPRVYRVYRGDRGRPRQDRGHPRLAYTLLPLRGTKFPQPRALLSQIRQELQLLSRPAHRAAQINSFRLEQFRQPGLPADKGRLNHSFSSSASRLRQVVRRHDGRLRFRHWSSSFARITPGFLLQ